MPFASQAAILTAIESIPGYVFRAAPTQPTPTDVDTAIGWTRYEVTIVLRDRDVLRTETIQVIEDSRAGGSGQFFFLRGDPRPPSAIDAPQREIREDVRSRVGSTVGTFLITGIDVIRAIAVDRAEVLIFGQENSTGPIVRRQSFATWNGSSVDYTAPTTPV